MVLNFVNQYRMDKMDKMFQNGNNLYEIGQNSFKLVELFPNILIYKIDIFFIRNNVILKRKFKNVFQMLKNSNFF